MYGLYGLNIGEGYSMNYDFSPNMWLNNNGTWAVDANPYPNLPLINAMGCLDTMTGYVINSWSSQLGVPLFDTGIFSTLMYTLPLMRKSKQPTTDYTAPDFSGFFSEEAYQAATGDNDTIIYRNPNREAGGDVIVRGNQGNGSGTGAENQGNGSGTGTGTGTGTGVENQGNGSGTGTTDNSKSPFGDYTNVEVYNPQTGEKKSILADGDLTVYTLKADEVYLVTYKNGEQKQFDNNHDEAHRFWNRDNDRSNKIENGKLVVQGNDSSNQNSFYGFALTMNRDAKVRMEKQDIAGMTEDLMLFDGNEDETLSLEEFLKSADMYYENCQSKAGEKDATERVTSRVKLTADDKIYLTALFKSMTVDNDELTVDEYKAFINDFSSRVKDNFVTRAQMDDYANTYRKNLKATLPATVEEEVVGEEVIKEVQPVVVPENPTAKSNADKTLEAKIAWEKSDDTAPFDILGDKREAFEKAIENGNQDELDNIYSTTLSDLAGAYIKYANTDADANSLTLEEVKAFENDNTSEREIEMAFEMTDLTGDNLLNKDEIAAFFMTLDEISDSFGKRDGKISK